MFFIDDHEAEFVIWDRGEDRRASSSDNIGLAISHPTPVAMPLRRGETGMEDRRGRTWKSGEHTSGGLRREGDFWNQNEDGPAGVEGLSGESKVDLGFSASGDAEEQVARKTTAKRASDRFDGRRL